MSPRDDLFALAADYARHFDESLDTRRVGAEASFDDVRAALGGPLPDEGREDAAVLRELIAAAEPGIVGSQTGRYFGFVFGSALPAAVAADWVATAWDQNGFSVVSSPAASAAEAVAAEWIADLLGPPAGVSSGFVTGAQGAPRCRQSGRPRSAASSATRWTRRSSCPSSGWHATDSTSGSSA